MSQGEQRGKVGDHPFVVAGLGLLGACIIALGTIYAAHIGNSGHGTGNTPAAAPSGASQSGHRGATQAKNVIVRWHGSISISDPGIDLDDLPPTTDQSNFTVWNDGGQLEVGTNVTFAAWNGAAKPGYTQCHDWVLTHGVQQLQLTTGLDLCVLTAGGRTAYVTITSLSGSNTTTAGAEATVWNLASG
jgi:hypothetical protein